MLTYINASFENNPKTGTIKINIEPAVEIIENTFSIVISKKNMSRSGEQWKEIYRKEVVSIEDINISAADISVLAGSVYDYNIDIYSGNNLVESQLYSGIRCWFEGLFVGNFNKYYVAGSNFKTDYKKNRSVESVTTLASKYPYIVSNAALNYYTGTSTGMFLQLSEDGKKFMPDTYNAYTNEILEFLCDGTEKIIKTHDGNMWYVSIDANPQIVNTGFWGANEIQFSWTEIGEVPIENIVIFKAGE